MFNLALPLIIASCLSALATSQPFQARIIDASAFGNVLPRLWYPKPDDNNGGQRPPIIIVQPPTQPSTPSVPSTPLYPPIYTPPTYPQYPQYPGFPTWPINFTRPSGLEFLFGNPGGAFIVINPNNAQTITTTSSNSTGRYLSARPTLVGLLEGLSAQYSENVNAAAAPEDSDAVDTVDDDISEDDQALLERQASHGLSPRQLISLLKQDNRRKRVQEAVAGVYLRNYNARKN